MADRPVFDVDKCPVAYVEPIPGGSLLGDATVADPPPTIPDCLDTAIVPLPPPDPCPEIVQGAATIAYGDAVDTPGIAFSVTPGDCCDFTLGLAVQIPCPPITIAGESGITRVITGTTDPVGHISLVMRREADCALDFDIEAAVPCTTITAPEAPRPVALGDDETGSVALALTRTGVGCDLAFDLDLTAPCPAIAGPPAPRPVSFVDPGNPSLVQLSAARYPGCQTDLDIGLQLACPALESRVKDKPLRGSATGSGTATLSIAPPADSASLSDSAGNPVRDRCDFAFDLDLALPRPLLGFVLGFSFGFYNVWRVTIYPDGYGVAATARDVDVQILGLPNHPNLFVPVGDWLGPIFAVGDDEESTLYYCLYRRTGFVGITTSQIDARANATTPGTGTANIYRFNGTTLAVASTGQTIYNTAKTTPTASGRLIQLKKVDGFLFLDVDDCG